MLDYNKYPPQWVDLSEFDAEDHTFQCRRVPRTQEQLNDLAKSMANVGQEQPILGRRLKNGKIQKVYGFGRFDVAVLMGWKQIWAVVVPEEELPDKEARKMSITNNSKSGAKLVDLDLMFICKACYEIDNMTYVEIGEIIGKSEAQVRRYIKLANAPADLQAKVKAGETTLTDATDNQKRRGDAFSEINKNNYVKSTKKGFKAFLNFSQKTDTEESIDKHIEDIKAAWKQMQKAAAKKARKSQKNDKADTNQSSQPDGAAQPQVSSRTQGETLPLDQNAAAGFDLIELKLSFDPSNPPAEKLAEISLALNESKQIYATAQVMGNLIPLDKNNKEIKWQGEGVEVTPDWGPEVTIKLPAPLAQPGKLTVSCRMPNGKVIEASAVVRQG